MTLENIIQKFDEKFTNFPEPLRNGERLLAYSVDAGMAKDFLRSSYSELLGEVVEEIEKEKFPFQIPKGEEDRYKIATGQLRALDTAISIINSKLPKEDSIN